MISRFSSSQLDSDLSASLLYIILLSLSKSLSAAPQFNLICYELAHVTRETVLADSFILSPLRPQCLFHLF